MLRIYRRHEKRCPLTSNGEPNCPGKVKCPVWITGTLLDGTVIRPKPLQAKAGSGLEALMAQGRTEDALAYAEASRGLNNTESSINAMCERILLLLAVPIRRTSGTR
jgi:hypothetical protein